jgi:hypothetical protein
VLSLIPGGKYALYPFRIFTTWIHECCHAAMALLMGGSVNHITLAPDTSGLTRYQIPKSRFRQAIVTSAGYPGASVAGCALYAASQSMGADGARLMLGVVGGALLLSLFFWVRGLFGMLAVIVLAGALLSAARLAPLPWAIDLVAFLAIQTALGALLDARELFALSPNARSDAELMRTLLWLPPAFWALLWLGLSVTLTYWTIRRFTP